jgi:putative tricarboxylic transport membrane protein
MRTSKGGRKFFLTAAIWIPVLFLSFVSRQVFAAWTPTKPIELVVPAGPGGGSDVLARTLVSIIEAEKLSPVNLVVVNRPGGGSLVGMTAVAQQKGNPHVLMTYHSGQVGAPHVAGQAVATYRDFTLLASIAIDEQILCVKADAPYKTVKDLVAAAKDRGGAMTVGGVTTGQDDHLCNRLLERAAGIKTRFVSFNGGGENLTAVLGGHVDCIWANPSEVAPALEGKQARALAVAKETRLTYMADVPTFKEHGYDVTWKMFRGIVGTPAIPPEAIAFYETMLKRATESSRWKEGFLKRYMLTASWSGHQEFTTFVGQQEQVTVGILKELGLIK